MERFRFIAFYEKSRLSATLLNLDFVMNGFVMLFKPLSSTFFIRLFYILLILLYIGTEYTFWKWYGVKRDSDFRAFDWDTETLWKLKPSYKGETFMQPLETNAQGFRGPVDTPIQKTHAIRIITIGDSRTYGFTVPNQESFPVVLERNLQKYSVDAQVINAGVHGYSIVQCRARLQQLLEYKPDLVIFAPGYNDRRYIISRLPDSIETFHRIARLRQISEMFQISHIFFGLMYVTGKHRINTIMKNPPPMDEAPLRVDENRFLEELELTVQICKENGIQLLLLALWSNPGVYGFINENVRLHEEGDTQKAIQRLADAGHFIPNYSHTISHYYLGKMYESIGEIEKSREAFQNHVVHGSISGELTIRLEKYYMQKIQDAAKRHHLINMDSNEMLIGDIPYESPDEMLIQYYSDDCHFTKSGNQLIGAALAQRLLTEWHEKNTIYNK